MRPSFQVQFDFTSSPTISEFVTHWPENPYARAVLGIFGPVGSGKSTGCCAKMMAIAMAQLPDPEDNIRRSRIAIIRATTPQLKSTTIKTWGDMFPPERCGRIVYTSPINQRVCVPTGPRGEPGMDAEFLFIALDNDQDVHKLKSMDLTAAYINEADGVSPAIFRYIRKRLGRYPKKKSSRYQAQFPILVMDCNAVDEDDPLAEYYRNPPEDWVFWKQPPAVLEVQQIGERRYVCVEDDIRYKGMEFTGRAYEAAARLWMLNPEAENLEHLQDGYYETQLSGSKLSEIQRDVQVKFVFSSSGKPVIADYSDDIHCREFSVLTDVPLEIGSDVGGGTLNPAALVFQRHPRGGILIHDELAGELGIDRFNKELNRLVQKPHLSAAPVVDGKITLHTDPAGAKADEVYETAGFEHLRKGGWRVMPAWSNDPLLRIEAITNAATRIVGGVPGLLIHPRCVLLRKALSGKWQYKRLKISGTEDRYRETPDKNHPWSDLGDACGYACMGAGETQRLRRGPANRAVVTLDPYSTRKVPTARTDFDPFGA